MTVEHPALSDRPFLAAEEGVLFYRGDPGSRDLLLIKHEQLLVITTGQKGAPSYWQGESKQAGLS